jgi:hypothetical protein
VSGWGGIEGAYHYDGHPAVMKIERKPVGVGTEFRLACDGSTGSGSRCLLFFATDATY